MTQNTKRFHNAFLMLLIAALIPTGMVLFTQPAAAHLPVPFDQVVDVLNGQACTYNAIGTTEQVRNGCCYGNDGSQRVQYDEYRCDEGRSGLRWYWVREWCTRALCYG